jgi:hypothetical protein
MATIQLTTYHDAVEYLIGYAGGDPQTKTVNDCQRSIINGYREFNASHEWSYLFQRQRITTVAPYSTGTVTYTNATRALDLAGGTWPTWAAYGTVMIANVVYEVASRASGTQLILSQSSNPGADLAAGTSYSIFRDTYPMPCDYQRGFDMIELVGGQLCTQVVPVDWLTPQQLSASAAKPRQFCVTADPNYLGVLAARFFPRPDAAYNFDFIYYRRPRQLNILDYNTGTVTVANGSSSVAGTSTSWAQKHVGSVIRFSPNGEKNPPTSLSGAYPYAYERVITGVTNATSLTVDEVLSEDLTGVKYRISDPLDLEEGAAMTAFWRESEKQLRSIKRMKSLPAEDQDYQMSYMRAREMDSRSMSLRVVGGSVAYRRRLSDMPVGDMFPAG